MANPAFIAVTDLAANGSTESLLPNEFNANGSFPVLIEGNTDRVFLAIRNFAAADLVVTVKASDNPPAGFVSHDIEFTLAGDEDRKEHFLGPFESSRCLAQEDGTLAVEIEAASGSPNARIWAFRFPKI